MPLTKSLHKVNKKLAKQSAGALHVKGRKFKQLNRATERENKLKLKKLRYAEQKNHELLFYLHIQESINEIPDQTTFSIEESRQLIDAYLHRNDDELAQMESERRKGRPMTNKHQIMLEKKKHDFHIFETGLRTPDLLDAQTVRRVREWNGTSGAVSAWKFTLVTAGDSTLAEDHTTSDMMS